MKAKDFNRFQGTDLERKLGRDQVVKYRLVGIKKDPENKNRELIPFNRNLPVTDQVIDKNGDPVNIAYIRRENADGTAIMGNIDFVIDNAGYVILRGRNPEDHKKYQFMEICNYNQSNKDRNPAVKPLFYRVDDKASAKKELDKRKTIREALNMIADLNDSQVDIVAKLIGKKQKTAEETRNSVESYAEKEPEKIMEVINNKNADTEALLKDAAGQGLLTLDNKKNQFFYNEKKIFSFTKGRGAKPYDQLAGYLLSEKPDLLDEIKDRVKLKT